MPIKNEHITDQNLRNNEFRNNPKLDTLINQLRQLLEPAEALFIQEYSTPQYPVVLVVGNSRSGSTLLTQVLAASGIFSYPSNVLNRFAYAPAIGAMIQQILFDKEYTHLQELNDVQSAINFTSNLGKTDGAMGISEFYHFWRRFLRVYDLEYINPNELAKVDIIGLRRELAALESVFGKPFMCKGKAIQYNISYFADRLPELFFIHIEREPLYVMQSLLQSRRKYYQSDSTWFGAKPAEYIQLKDMDIYHQIAGQVLFTDHAIHSQLAKVVADTSIHCKYEDFCANSGEFFDRLNRKLAPKGVRMTPYQLNEKLISNANKQSLETHELTQLQTAYENLLSEFFS